MKINHNMAAAITNAQLLRAENGLAASMERLSSGIKLNHAKDDPAGVAIANKMQAQIDGLAQASENASNGVSVLQIADSALGEITAMLQRMRELSVQAATDTNKLEDREAIQQEICALKEEVDRISRDTEYNTKKLLDGTSDTRVYADGLSRMAISDFVASGTYSIEITAAATQANLEASTQAGIVPAGNVIINGMEVSISKGERAESVFEKLRSCAEKGGVSIAVYDPSVPFQFGDTLKFVSNQYGSASEVNISCSNTELKNFLGLGGIPEAGTNAQVALDKSSSSFGAQATILMDGNKAKITDINGFEMTFMVTPGMVSPVDIEVTDIGTMTLQIGANEFQTMEVRIPEISSRTLYLDEIDVTRVQGGDKAIGTLDAAITITSSVRSSLGAYQNRLEYAVDSLNSSEEDTTDALSRMADTDMAKEMSEYTKFTVLQQAATSVLAQANDIPQTILQLLQ